MVADIETRVAEALAAPYHRVIRAYDDGFAAMVVELPGCFSSGETGAEAVTNLEEAMALWVEVELERGHDIPPPIDTESFSGRVTLRIPPSLHERAAIRARLEGVSLNRLLSAAIAAYTGEIQPSIVGRGAADVDEKAKRTRGDQIGQPLRVEPRWADLPSRERQ